MSSRKGDKYYFYYSLAHNSPRDKKKFSCLNIRRKIDSYPDHL